MSDVKLKIVRAKCGCDGCFYENRSDCHVEKIISGLPVKLWPPVEEWECSKEEESIIYVEDKDE